MGFFLALQISAKAKTALEAEIFGLVEGTVHPMIENTYFSS